MRIHHLAAALNIGMFILTAAAPVYAESKEAASATQPAVGQKTPDFNLKTLDDKPVQLSALLKDGPVVVVMLRGWVGYQCPVCTKEVASLTAKASDITATGARVVLIYPGQADGLKAHAQEFATGKQIPDKFYFVTDPDLAVVNAYGLRWDAKGELAYPATFVLDADGTVTFCKISHSHGGRATVEEIVKALPKK